MRKFLRTIYIILIYFLEQLIKIFIEHNIEYRPIVTGNFVKNKEVLEFFDYEVFGSMLEAEHLDTNGLFIGNHHIDVSKELEQIRALLPND